MNILYFSCHEILEYDDLAMFHDAGHRVFSLGAFCDPSVTSYQFRQPRPDFIDAELWEAYVEAGGILHAKRVPDSFARHFDVVVVNHYAQWVVENSEALAGLPIVIRTIGQSRLSMEQQYAALSDRVHIVRYSEREVGLPGFAKTDGVIYFGKPFSGVPAWAGGGGGLTFHNAYPARDEVSYPKAEAWRRIAAASSARLYGAWNDGMPEAEGTVAAADMPGLYQSADFYLYVYTHPPSYTLSLIEAMMAGVPIVAPSERYIAEQLRASDDDAWSPHRYEVPAIIGNGGGVAYDSVEEAAKAVRWLSQNRSMAEGMSRQSRANAHAKFDAAVIGQQWDDFLKSIV